MTFTVLIHHMGLFDYKLPHLHYRVGHVNVHSRIDLDTWSFFKCQDLVKDLGYTVGKFKLWWRKEEDAENHKIRPLLNDEHAMQLGSYAEHKKQNVEVFVEHDYEELSFSVFCQPITVIKPPYNPPLKNPSPSMPAQPKFGLPKLPQIKGCQPKPFKPPSKNPDPSKPEPAKTAQPKCGPAKPPQTKSCPSNNSKPCEPKLGPPKAPPKAKQSKTASPKAKQPKTAPPKAKQASQAKIVPPPKPHKPKLSHPKPHLKALNPKISHPKLAHQMLLKLQEPLQILHQ